MRLWERSTHRHSVHPQDRCFIVKFLVDLDDAYALYLLPSLFLILVMVLDFLLGELPLHEKVALMGFLNQLHASPLSLEWT